MTPRFVWNAKNRHPVLAHLQPSPSTCHNTPSLRRAPNLTAWSDSLPFPSGLPQQLDFPTTSSGLGLLGATVKMPLGWERINVKKTVPNKNIVFIKPRPGPDEATSRDFLERIAAQCLPIMNNNQLSVASLEEYEPNLKFWGTHAP